MNDLAVVVYSCDKNEELWSIFNHCINKYWKDHPTVYLLTETINCPFFKTISLNYDLMYWTTRIRNSLKQIKEKYVVFLSDDIFINDYVNTKKLEQCLKILKNDIYSGIQFELSWNSKDVDSKYEGFKYKPEGSLYRVSLLCGIWNKNDLIDVLKEDTHPWAVEIKKDYKNEFLQICDEKVLSWHNDKYGGNGAIRFGKWQHGVEEFLEKEGLKVDFSKKGFVEK